MAKSETDVDLITLTADIVSAFASGERNRVSADDLPRLISSVHKTLANLGASPEETIEQQKPAVSIRASIKPDYLICLEDGAKLKMLKRYLKRNFNMTPDDYRKKWNLPDSYPMVAPNYAEKRKELAKSIGLGRKLRKKTTRG